MSMHVGLADSSEYEAIYAMGFDVWGAGTTLEAFVEGCRRSPKYASGRWFVIREKGQAVSSLLVHDFDSWSGAVVRGVGSLATRPERRRAGWAARLLNQVVELLVKSEAASIVLLYADISPAYYEKHAFHALDAAYQSRADSVLMARLAPGVDMSLVQQNASGLPSYF